MTGSQVSTGGSSCGNNSAHNYSPWGSGQYQENIYNNPMPFPSHHQQQHRYPHQPLPAVPPTGVSCCNGAPPHSYRNYTNEFKPKQRCHAASRPCGSYDALTSPQTPLLPNPDWFPAHNSHPNGIYVCGSDCSDHSLKAHLHHSGGPKKGRGQARHHHNGAQHNNKHPQNGSGHFGPPTSHSSNELKVTKECCESSSSPDNCDSTCGGTRSTGGGDAGGSGGGNSSSNNSSINNKSSDSRIKRSGSSGCNEVIMMCGGDHEDRNSSGKSSYVNNVITGGNYDDSENNECCGMSRDAHEEDDTCSCSESSCLYAEAAEPMHQAQIVRVG